MKKKYLLLISLAGFIISFDQITKYYIHHHFQLGESFELISNFFAFTYVRNYGAAFGVLASAPDWFRQPFFYITPLVVLGIIFYIFHQFKEEDLLKNIFVSFIIGGALGNFADRLQYGFVVDFIDVYWYQHHWPAFNIADSFISVGMTLWIIDTFLEERKLRQQQNSQQQASAKPTT